MSRNLLMGVSVNRIHVKYDAVARWQGINHFQQIFCFQLTFQLCVVRFAIGSFDIGFEIHIFVLSQVAQGFIHDHFPDPAFKTPFAFVLVYPFEDFREGHHQHILRFHFAFHIPTAERVHFARKLLKKGLLSMTIMLFTPFDQLAFLSPVNLESHLNEFTYKMRKWGQGLHGVREYLVPGDSPESPKRWSLVIWLSLRLNNPPPMTNN